MLLGLFGFGIGQNLANFGVLGEISCLVGVFCRFDGFGVLGLVLACSGWILLVYMLSGGDFVVLG